MLLRNASKVRESVATSRTVRASIMRRHLKQHATRRNCGTFSVGSCEHAPPPPFPPYFPTPHPKLPAQQPWTPPVLRPFRPCRWPRSAPPPPPTWPPPPPTTHWAGQRGASPNTVPRRRSQSTVSPGTGRRLPVKHTGACNSARGGARECSQGHGQQVLCTTYNAYLL